MKNKIIIDDKQNHNLVHTLLILTLKQCRENNIKPFVDSGYHLGLNANLYLGENNG